MPTLCMHLLDHMWTNFNLLSDEGKFMEDVEVSDISMVDHHGRAACCLPCLSVAMKGVLHMSLDAALVPVSAVDAHQHGTSLLMTCCLVPDRPYRTCAYTYMSGLLLTYQHTAIC